MIINEFLIQHKKLFNQTKGEYFHSCTDCGKILSNSFAKSIGLGSTCQKKHEMNYTVIPYFEGCITLFDNLKEDLDVDLIICLDASGHSSMWDDGTKLFAKWFVNNDQPPYNWVEVDDAEISALEKYLKYALEMYEYVPHNLCQKGDKEEWDYFIILTEEASLQMKRKDAIGPQYENFAEYENSVEWHNSKLRFVDAGHRDEIFYHEMIDIRSISSHDMLVGGNKQSPYHIDYPEYSIFQKMYIERFCHGQYGHEWHWENYLNSEGLEQDYGMSRMDSIFGEESDNKNHPSYHDRRMWEELLDHILQKTEYNLPASIKKLTPGTHWMSLDWTQWMFPDLNFGWHCWYPIYNTKGEVVYVDDVWGNNHDNIYMQLEWWYETTFYDDDEYNEKVMDNLEKLIKLSLSNLHTTKPLTT